MKEKVICWDLDETLGEFRRVAYEMAAHELAETKDGEYFKQLAQKTPLGIRAGIKKFLSELTAEGYIHFVNTAGMTEYAQEALSRTGLIPFFEKVYGREATDTGTIASGKLFHHIARYMHYSYEQAIQNMVVIGDDDIDTPADINNLVTIIDRYGPYHDVQITRTALDALQELGEGNFATGFKNLYTLSRSIYPYESIEYRKLHPEREIVVDNDFLFCLYYYETTTWEGLIRTGTSKDGYPVYTYDKQRIPKGRLFRPLEGSIPRLIIYESRGFMQPERLDLRRDLELF